MLIYNLPIQGILGNPEKGATEKHFTYTDLLMHLKAAKDYQAVNLVINSIGGYVDEAEKMIQALKASGKLLMSENSGNVMSAALTLFLLPEKQYRFFYPNKGQMLAHFPWGGAEGEASELAQYAKDLQKTENKYVDFYAERTGCDVEIMRGLMAENKELTTEQVEAFGFANIATAPTVAMAFLKQSNKSKMDNFKIEKMESRLSKLMRFLGFKMIVITDAMGNELDFGEIKDESEIVAGVPVTVAGSPANGEFTMPDGKVYKCENGILTEIVMPEPSELEQAKQEIERLKSELEGKTSEASQLAEKLSVVEGDFKAFKDQAKQEVESIEKEFKAFKSQYKPADPQHNVPKRQESNEPVKQFLKLKPRN